MGLLRGLPVLTLALGLVAPAPAAPPTTRARTSTRATAKAAHHHHHVVHGTVVSVHHGQDGHGTIKVKLAGHHHRKNKAVSARAAAKKHHHHGLATFKVNKHSKFDFLTSQNGKEHHHPASFGAVQKGEHVRIHVGHHHHAKKVDILKGQQTQAGTKKPTTKEPTKKKPTTKKK
jgi:hypothetical protein